MTRQKLYLVALLTAVMSCGSFNGPGQAAPFKWPMAGDKTPEQPEPKPILKAPAGEPSSLQSAAEAAARESTTKSSEPDLKRRGPIAPEAIKHYNKGVELHSSGSLNPAIEEYKAALAADPRIEQAYSNLGGIYAAQRSYNKAMDAFEKANELNPNRATTLNGMATVLYARGKIEEAKERWKQAVQVEPRFAAAYYNIGNAYEGEKKPMEAIEWYIKAYDTNPKMADALFRVGCTYFKEKHPAPAEMMLERAIDAAPDAEFVKEARKLIASIRGDYQKDMQSQGEVRMNIVPPPDPKGRGTSSEAAPSAASSETVSTSDAGNDDILKQAKKRKKKKHQEEAPAIPMSVSADPGDLQQKPAQ